MKKIGVLAIIIGLHVGVVSAQETPSSLTGISAVNISNDNQDAVTEGAVGGDIVRYQLRYSSQMQSAEEVTPRINVAEVIRAAHIIELGGGELVGSEIVFPTFSLSAPFEKDFTFFVRIKPECGELESMRAESEGRSINVKLLCGSKGLTRTGPAWWVGIVLLVLGTGTLLGLSSGRARR